MKKIVMKEVDVNTFMSKIKAMLLGEKGLPDKLNVDVNPSEKLKDEDKVEVVFENEAYKKMNALVDNCDKEIGWYGTVERTSEKQFVIKDIIMFPQEVTGATVQTDDLEYTNWSNGLADEVFNSMRFYGHSHVRMTCTPSLTDSDHYKSMIQNCQDFYIFGIFNKNTTNNYWFNIYDIQNNILYEKEDIVYKYMITSADQWAEAQIKEFVKEKKYTPTMYGRYGGNYWNNKLAENKNAEKDKKEWSQFDAWNSRYYD